MKPSVVGTLDGKAGTKDPVEVITDPNTKVELLDKDGNVIGSGTTDSTGHATITPTVPIPEGNVTVKATDNAEHPNSSVSKPVKATKPTVKSGKKLNTIKQKYLRTIIQKSIETKIQINLKIQYVVKRKMKLM